MWPWGIGAVLAATVAANGALLYVASGDPSFVIEPNYYAKAVAWDSTIAERARNDVLGWRLVPSLSPFSVRDGSRLTVTLVDDRGSSIDDAVVTVSALHVARAAEVLRATLQHERATYVATLPVTHRGLWELRFDVTRRGQRFTHLARVEASGPEPHR